jgi:SRSO17 transposase
MTPSDVRAAAQELVRLHGRFAPLFGRTEARAQSLVYLRGLLGAEGRKRAEPMALVFGQPTEGEGNQLHVLALQRFLPYSPWDAQDIHREIQAVFAEELVPSTARWSLGTGGVIDGSGFGKKGTARVGVQRQYCGRLGKQENCPVGVFLVGVTPDGCALLDDQLYLPREWATDKERREKGYVPKQVRFRTEPQLGIDLLRRTQEVGKVRFAWVIADERDGQNGTFLDGLDEWQQHDVVEVPVNTTGWTEDPAEAVPPYRGRGRPPTRAPRNTGRSVQAIAADLPAAAWQTWQLRDGATGPVVFQFAAVRVWAVRHRRPGPPIWLVVRRSLEPDAEIKYYVSNAPEDTPLETMALVTGCRYRVEEFLEEGKSYLGMAQYEARAWSSWHHHMSLVALAHLFVTLTRLRLKKNARDDAGHGGAAVEERPAAAHADGGRCHRDHGVPPAAQSHRQKFPLQALEEASQEGPIQSVAVELGPVHPRSCLSPIVCRHWLRVAKPPSPEVRNAALLV